MSQAPAVHLDAVVSETLRRLENPEYRETSLRMIYTLLSKANPVNHGLSWADLDTPRSPRTILMEVWIGSGRFHARMVHHSTRQIMEALDTDPRVLAHEIKAETRRCRSEQACDNPHAGIHLYPAHADQAVFYSNDGISFDVHFRPDPHYTPITKFISPFDVEKLECRAGIPISTGPVRARDGQRYFKYTIVSPGEKPGAGEYAGNPVHLDPHILDHDDPTEE